MSTKPMFDEKAAIEHYEKHLKDSRSSPLDAYRWQFTQLQSEIETLAESFNAKHEKLVELQGELKAERAKVTRLFKATRELADGCERAGVDPLVLKDVRAAMDALSKGGENE